MVKHNDAGGGMTVKEAVITSVKVAAIIGALYILIYFIAVVLLYAGVREFGNFFVGTLKLYPNSLPEDLNIEMIEGMSRTVLYLCVIFIPVALYRKIKKQ